jgi:AAA+ ATPase superfamily predicted ATPase
MKIIGRRNEIAELERVRGSGKPELVAVTGRRRVGKTYLVKEFFANDFAFQLTGIRDEATSEQLLNFDKAIQIRSKKKYPAAKSWLDAFWVLREFLQTSSVKGKRQAVFIDEMPWLAKQKSGFLPAFEHFWNDWASSQPDVILIACGSQASWIVNNLYKNKGGFHNRITSRIKLSPFSLKECEEFFAFKGVALNRQQILESYMILGGIPFYLDLFLPNLSLPQNIDRLFFTDNAPLKDEYGELYASLFNHPGQHMRIVEALSTRRAGLTRTEIIEQTGLPNGGSFSAALVDLGQCGFVEQYQDFTKPKRGVIVRLTDNFTLYYLRYVMDNRSKDDYFWTNYTADGGYATWVGLAFEQLCLAHIPQIKKKLGISGVSTRVASWRGAGAEEAAQIDLLIDRKDGVINLCEMKYTLHPFAVDKETDLALDRKKRVFIAETKTRKAIHITMVTTYGLRPGGYRGSIQSEVTMSDLFESA